VARFRGLIDSGEQFARMSKTAKASQLSPAEFEKRWMEQSMVASQTRTGGWLDMKRANRFRLLAIGTVTLLLLLGSATSFAAAPTDEAKAIIARWTATYNAGDGEGLVKFYTPDAVLLGTRSLIISQGTDAVRTYFSTVKPTTGDKVRFDDVRMIVAGDLRSVVVTGFYTFLRGPAQKPDPARFTWACG
jgi:uncharacterized protein (TIGR02246 family)